MRLCWTALLVTAALAQTVIRINVNLVQIDAVATDSNGNPIADLKPADFEIRQDGKLQTITNFSYIAGASTTAPKPPVKVRTLPMPPAVLKAADIRRTIVFVVDDFSLPFADLARTRESLKKFADEQMQPGDLVAVVRTTGGMGAFQRFTSDPRQFRAAIDRLTFNHMVARPASFVALSADPMAQAAQARDQRFSVGTLGSIRYVADGLREMPGRKSLILFSENLPLFRLPNFANPDSPGGPEPDMGGAVDGMREALHRLVDAANRASIVIHTVDPRGVGSGGGVIGAQPGASRPGDTALLDQAILASQDGLVMLADQTGGLFLANNNDIGGLVRKALVQSSSYFLIGYRPDSETFSMSAAERFHRLSVKVTRPGAHVFSRSGFFGNPDPPDGKVRATVPLTAQAQLQHALDAPFSTGNIHLRLTALFTDAPQSGPFLNTLLHIDGRDVRFTTEPDGSHKAVFDLLAATFGEKGGLVGTINRTYTLHCRPAACEEGREQGFVYALNYPIAKPGAYQMRVALRDAASGDTGSASQFIEVPDIRNGRLTLSSLILHGASPLTPAVRVFPRAAEIEYGYQVLNAHTDSHLHPKLEEQAILYRDGAPVFTGPVTPLDVATRPEPSPLVAGGALKLGDRMPPGSYVLQVVVTDKLSKGKYQTASEWMDFEILP